MLVVHPENLVAWMGEAISSSDCARHRPHHPSCSELGRAQNAGLTESAPLRTTRVPEPERLRPGRCMQPRASLGRSWWSNLETELCGQGGCMRHEGGRPSVAETLQAHTSVICLQRPSLLTVRLNK